MKTRTLVNRLVLTLIGLNFYVFFIGAAGQTLNVFDIPNQTINPGQSFSEISLDDYIDVPPNDLHNIEWTASGANQLNVNIDNGRKATIIPLSDTWIGSETITFHATDTDLNTGSDDATFTVQQAPNADPVVSDIPDQTVDEGSAFQSLNLDDFVTDADDPIEQLTWSASGNSALSVDINAGSHMAIIGVTDTEWNGSETIIFKATDPSSGSSEDAATFTLTPVNDPPVVGNIPDQSINSGESFNSIALDDFVTDVDNNKSELSWTVTGNTDLTPAVDGSNIATINQPANWTGSEKLTFAVTDPSNASASDDAVFEAKAVNANPVSVDDNYSTSQGATLNIAAPGVLSNDSDADLDPLTAIKVTDPSHGTLTLNSDGSFSYVNDNSTSTTDAFTYRASDGTNESEIATVTINITLNAPPSLGSIESSTLNYTEGDGPVSVTSSITVSDDDDTDLTSAVITISSNYQNGEDVLSFTNSGGINGSWNAGAGQLSLSGTASVAGYQAALRAVKYTNSSANPNNFTRTVTFRVSDGTDNSNTVSRTISVTGTNLPPVLGGIEGGALSYSEGDGPVIITSNITVSDGDNSNLASAVISISSNYQNGEDALSFTNTASITGSWNATTGQLSLTGNATLLSYRAALRAVRYTNSSVNPSTLTRTVSFRVNDGTDNSNTVNRNISVSGINVAPVLGGIEGSALGYVEGDGPVSVTSNITVSDVDNTNLASAVISISSNYQNGEDVLSFTNTGSITGSWNAAGGQLTLSGNASVASYQAALRAVKYTNNSNNPVNLTRTVTFRVNDGAENSNLVSRTISLTDINTAPVLAGIEGSTLAYTEGDGPVSVTSSLTATDADNTNLTSAVIIISSNYQNGEDVLSFTNTGSITGSWNAAGGQLTLSGNATVASYQVALRAVKYTNNSNNPVNLTRTVSFRVNDGTDNSNSVSRNISVTATNIAPVLGGIEGSALAYSKGDGPVIITSLITVSDGDDANLASALVTISSNYQNGEDVLSFTNTGSITGVWNAAAGQLSLTGVTTVANYRTALRSVRYTNNSASPSNLTRTVTFRVSDGTDNSNTVGRNISVSSFNSTPVLDNIEGTTLAYTEGASPVNITASLTVFDSDNPNLASATVTITGNYQNDEDVLSFTNANGIAGVWNAGSGQLTLSGSATVAAYQSALRTVKYANTSNNPNTATRVITFRVNDGTDNSNTLTRSISITPVNNPPVLAGIETTALAYTEGNGPLSISNTITVTDEDDLTLPSATVSITANYKNTQDVLSFTNANGVTGSWNVATGTLTLTGNVSPVQMQAALRTVKYTNTSNNPNTDVRTITFRVNDGTANSNLVTRNINVTRVGEFSGSISGTASYCVGSVMPIVLTISDGTAPFSATLTRTGSILNKDTVITGIPASPHTINVRLTGSYVLSKLTDSQDDEATLSATPVVLSTYAKPTGVLTGPSTVCNDGQPVQMTLNLTGTAPWQFTVRRGSAANDTTYTGITADPYRFNVRITSSPMSVKLISISDAHCTGDTTGSGTVRVVYLPSPTAAISGQDTLCPGETGNLKVTITGSAGPWSITYLKDGANPTVVNNIVTSPYTLNVVGPGTYSLSKVQQNSGCTGRVSGTAKISSFVVPTASLSGSSTFCEHASGNLSIRLTGNAPWMYSYRLNSGPPILVQNVASTPSTVPISKGGSYTLVEVHDKNCPGTTSGSANVTVTPAPEVSLSGLDPAYNKDSAQVVPLFGEPAGGTFTGPGVFAQGNDWFFISSFPPVGPHDFVYSYKDVTTQCFGYDTVTVRILKADAIIEFPGDRTKYCRNEDPFTVTGANKANSIGSFSISGGVGLVDHGDNTATVNPSQLSVKEYTITYTYFDGKTLTVTNNFEIGNAPDVDFKWESECFESGQSIEFKDASLSTFGNITSYNWKIYTLTGFDTASTKDFNYTFPEADNYNVELQVETSYGCSAIGSKVFGLKPTVNLLGQAVNESFEESPKSWQSATLTPSANSWTLDTPDNNSMINKAANGTKCWFTNLPGSNPPRENSWVTSPCYDFTGMKRPMVKMQIWRDFNGRRDGANLQATTDSAKTWFNIGQMDDGQNWYNEYLILGNPGGKSTGWSDVQDAGWKEARHSLDMLKGQKRVQFRIAYGSDGTVQNTEGFAFDDFWIGERNRMVLIEHFTNASDEESQAADAKLNNLVAADSVNTFDLQYHTDFPGDDPFYEQEPYAPSTRLLYYGIVDVPYAVLNGGYKSGYRFDYNPANDKDTNLIHLESLNDADFDLKFLSSGFDENQVTFELQINANTALTAHAYTIYAGIFERRVVGPGSFSGTIFQNVVRSFLPDPAGITIDEPWPVGGQKNYSYQWDIHPDISRDELMAFAFIQDEETHEVYQVNKVKIGYSSPSALPDYSHEKFMVFPNPARDQAFIRFEKPIQGDVRIEIFNNLGSLVHTETVSHTDNDIELLTDKYPNGLYIIRISTGNELLGVTKLNINQ